MNVVKNILNLLLTRINEKANVLFYFSFISIIVLFAILIKIELSIKQKRKMGENLNEYMLMMIGAHDTERLNDEFMRPRTNLPEQQRMNTTPTPESTDNVNAFDINFEEAYTGDIDEEIAYFTPIDGFLELTALDVIVTIQEHLELFNNHLVEPVDLDPGSQNVHERAVSQGIANVAEYIKEKNKDVVHIDEKEKIDFINMTMNQIINTPNLDVTQQQIKNALEVVDSIINKNDVDVVSGENEVTMLHLVLNHTIRMISSKQKIERNLDNIIEYKINVFTTLITQLAEAIEYGKTVCPKGRFGHISAITQGIDENVPDILSDEQVVDYANIRIGYHRNKFIDELPENERNAYISLRDTRLSDQVKRKLFNYVCKKIKKEIFDSKLMTEKKFTKFKEDNLQIEFM
jgi:hypothetical protein